MELGNNRRGLFVVFEGIDGSGKTTLIKALKGSKKISEAYREILFTYEPGGKDNTFGNKIRDLILREGNSLSEKTQALLFLASRSEHLEKIIQPALDREALIICDRYYLSTLVYQGKGDLDRINWIRKNQDFITFRKPDITFFLNLSWEEYLSRYKNKVESQENNWMDKLIYEDYLRMCKSYEIAMKEDISGRLILLDGGDSTNNLVKRIEDVLVEVANGR
ncbi:thymidylate kinase [Mycoplasma haemofelis str. Langford 1]|uniref:Thymidylate kinase n=1 Tax=Mycoplasma haemofelis (strain Langford 1) TaxID=941640 RepID=E8ZGK5_MYCHL|nr:dTMP kinase [Mycoplasma haemofelis]CBY92035.1 thymidylate kinase [Mycoplasma haemofelis str. Langford 1]